MRNFAVVSMGLPRTSALNSGILSTAPFRKRGNCECIATWGRPSHASPCPL